MILLRIDSQQVTSRLEQLHRLAARPRPMVQAATRATRTLLQRHFREKDKTPNKLGGRRTHFWLDIMRSTQMGEVTDNYGIVKIGDTRLSLHVRGGRVTAGKTISSKTGVPTRALSIPVAPEAHGRRPAALEATLGIKLFMVPKDFGTGLLAAASKDGSNIKVYYILRRSVQIPRDPTALPPGDHLARTAVAAAEAHLRAYAQQHQIV